MDCTDCKSFVAQNQIFSLVLLQYTSRFWPDQGLSALGGSVNDEADGSSGVYNAEEILGQREQQQCPSQV